MRCPRDCIVHPSSIAAPNAAALETSSPAPNSWASPRYRAISHRPSTAAAAMTVRAGRLAATVYPPTNSANGSAPAS